MSQSTAPAPACSSSAKPKRRAKAKKARKPKKDEPRHSLLPALREAVWIKYNGDRARGYCYVCEVAEITAFRNTEYGHVIPVALGGQDTIENLRPICSSCNRSMGTMNLEEYRARLVRSGFASERDTINAIARTPKPNVCDHVGSGPDEYITDVVTRVFFAQ